MESTFVEEEEERVQDQSVLVVVEPSQTTVARVRVIGIVYHRETLSLGS